MTKRTLPKVDPAESYAAACCRLAHQARLNSVTVTRPTEHYHFAPSWAVTSQSNGGGYTVTHHQATGTWECGCEAHTAGRLCAHVAVVRTREEDCPVCNAPLLVYTDAQSRGAVRCAGVCGLVTDLTASEAAAIYETLNHCTDQPVPLFGLLLQVAARCQDAQEAA